MTVVFACCSSGWGGSGPCDKGERHLKVMVEPVDGGPLLDGIAFNVDTSIWPDNGVREVQLAYKLDINEFRGNRSLQLIIDHLWPN